MVLPGLSQFLRDSQGVDPAQLDQMWKLLDDMAANNPDEYQKLITEAKEDMDQRKAAESFIPDPNFVISAVLEKVETQILDGRSGEGVAEFFINVCTSDRCLPPHRQEISAVTEADLSDCFIPISLGARRHDTKGEQISDRIIRDVVVHPLVAQRARQDFRFKKFLALLILARAAKAENRKFREISVQFPAIAYKAGKKPQPHFLHPSFTSQTITTQTAQMGQMGETTTSQRETKLIEEIKSLEEISVLTRGGRDWTEGTRVVVSGDLLEISVRLQSDTEISAAVEVEEAAGCVRLCFGGYEPLEISGLPNKLGECTQCKVSKKTRTLNIAFAI